LAPAAKVHFEQAVECAYTDDPVRASGLEAWRTISKRLQQDLPVCFMNAVEEYSSQSMEQEFQFLEGWFRSKTTVTDQQGSPVLWEIVDSTGRTHWQIHSGEVTEAWRGPDPGNWEVAIGAVGVFGTCREQILAAYRLAALQEGGILEGADELRFLARFARCEDLDLLTRDPGSGLHTTPGSAEGFLTWSGNQASLHIEWRDCLDAVIVSQDLFWKDVGLLPSVIKEIEYVPGTQAVVRTLTGWYSPLDDSVVSYKSIAWDPLPGQRVLDSRFQREVQYFIEADGTVIEDSEVVLLAEQEPAPPDSNTGGDPPDDDRAVLVTAGPAEIPDQDDGIGAGVDLVRWGVLTIGALGIAAGAFGVMRSRRKP
jgi:hypothetical protein